MEYALQLTHRMQANRRRTLRVHCELTASWKRGRKVIETRVRDVNADGLLLLTDDEYPVNQMMDLTITLPSGPVSVVAVSRLCGTTRHGRGIGVSILAMDQLDRAEWNRYYRTTLEDELGRLPETVSRLFAPE
jgi:hypothetical protein